MKKSVLCIFILGILLLSFVSINAEELVHLDPTSPEEPVEIAGVKLGPQDVEKSPEELANETTSYLKKEWTNILNKTAFLGPIIQLYERNAVWLAPFFVFTIGMEPGFSWVFLLSLVIWIFFAIVAYRVLKFFEIFESWVFFLAWFVFLVAMSFIGFPHGIAEIIVNTVSLIGNPIVQAVIAVLIVITLILLSIFSEAISEWIKEYKKLREEETLEEAKAKIKRLAKTAGAITKETIGSKKK